MKLSKRKEKILKAVVEAGMENGEPISSKTIQEKFMPDVSSATIRNELMSLEELGYITHIHTSSGRVPTAEGYKKYVQELMPTKKLTKKEVAQIQSNFTNKLVNLNEIMTRSAQTISDACNYASVVYMGGTGAIIENIKLVELSSTSKLVVVVTDIGVISEIVSLENTSQKDLEEAATILTKLFAGKPIEALEEERYLISQELIKYKELFTKIIFAIAGKYEKRPQIAVAGKEKFMDYPEFENIQKLKNAIKLVDSDEIINNTSDGGEDVEIKISVGDNDLSIVSATYKLKGNKTLSANVVGPVRMDYAKAISVLKEVSDTIKELTDKEI